MKRKMALLPLVVAAYSIVGGGPFRLEDLVLRERHIGVPPAEIPVLAVVRNEAEPSEPFGPFNALQFGAILMVAGFVAYLAARRNRSNR